MVFIVMLMIKDVTTFHHFQFGLSLKVGILTKPNIGTRLGWLFIPFCRIVSLGPLNPIWVGIVLQGQQLCETEQ